MIKKIFFIALATAISSFLPAMQPNQSQEKNDITYTYLPEQSYLFGTIDPKRWSYGFHLFQEEEQDLKRIIAQNEHQEIVGAISFGGVDEKQNEIHYLEVLPLHRGRSIGSELLKRAIVQLFTENKPEKVFLSSSHSAIPFYSKNGMSRDIRKLALFYINSDQIDSMRDSVFSDQE